ncbi:MAG: hypothetical protein IKT57_06010 [Clostridia bacterium]|nr:hypothetical protein [Clostridia bacterium]
MSQARGMNTYAMAGGQYASDDRFNVSAQVYMPDGAAGTVCASCYQAQAKKKLRRFSVGRNAALIYLGSLMFVCLMYLGMLMFQSNQLTKDLNGYTSSKHNSLLRIEVLKEKVADNTDISRISVMAREIGMVASEERNTYHLYVQEIEQFTKAEENKANLTAAAELPLQSAQAQLVGSR